MVKKCSWHPKKNNLSSTAADTFGTPISNSVSKWIRSLRIFDFVAGDNPSQLFELCPLFQLTRVTFDPALPYSMAVSMSNASTPSPGTAEQSSAVDSPVRLPRAPPDRPHLTAGRASQLSQPGSATPRHAPGYSGRVSRGTGDQSASSGGHRQPISGVRQRQLEYRHGRTQDASWGGRRPWLVCEGRDMTWALNSVLTEPFTMDFKPSLSVLFGHYSLPRRRILT